MASCFRIIHSVMAVKTLNHVQLLVSVKATVHLMIPDLCDCVGVFGCSGMLCNGW
jgi:hypothetical protein